MARPTYWTEDKKKAAIDTILEKIIEGKSCRSILDSDRENLPSNRLFIEWLSGDLELSKQYTQACELRSEKMADDILNICDSVEDDIIVLEDGREVVNNNVIQRDRLRVDTRKWLLAKMNPKKFGDRISQEITGEVTINKLSPEERQKRIDELIQKAKE